LGELGLAAARVSREHRPPAALREALDAIRRTARSRKPYAE
jgi:hypothetical protein